jgi:hypothetical protein
MFVFFTYINLKNLKDHSTAHAELQRIIREVRADHYTSEVLYAWLAITTLEDATLGTLDDAKHYCEKLIWATARREELYGLRTKESEPHVLEFLKRRMATLQSNAKAEKFRRDLDSNNRISIPDGCFVVVDRSVGPNELLRHLCLSCDNSAIDQGLPKLLKCGRCQQVHYCSKEFQAKVSSEVSSHSI